MHHLGHEGGDGAIPSHLALPVRSNSSAGTAMVCIHTAALEIDGGGEEGGEAAVAEDRERA